jgi:glutamate dehydrogenase
LASEAEQQSIDRNFSEQQRRNIGLFAERLFERLPADLTELINADKRLVIARDAFQFFSVRSEPVKVRAISAADGEDLAMVETAMRDCPFIIDSIHEYLHHLGIPVRMLLHPVFKVARDRQGRMISFENATANERRESFTHAELELAGTGQVPETIAAEVKGILGEVDQVTGDFEAMTSRALEICDETAAVRSLVEVREFLRWLVQGGFVFLGYRRYKVESRDGVSTIVADSESGLGILREARGSRYAKPVPIDELEPGRRKLFFEGPDLIIGKTRTESHVHRRAPMDDIAMRRKDERGRAVTFDRFIGLFTSKAYFEEAQFIPVLRAKLAEVLEAERVRPGSHDFKELITAFNSFPKEELFRAPVSELRAQLRPILDVENEGQVRLMLQWDEVRGNVIALVIMPRERFSAEVRMKMQEALARRLNGKPVYYYLAMGQSYTARLHFCFAAVAPDPSAAAAMEAEMVRMARTWDDRLREELIDKFGQARGHSLCTRWARAISPAYKAGTSVARAVADIERIEALFREAPFSVEVARHEEAGEVGTDELRMYDLAEAPILSELIPVLQNFGIRVLSENAYELTPEIEGKARRVYVQAFRVEAPSHQRLGAMPGAPLVTEALAAVRMGLAENDQLNALTLSVGLSWREVALLRAYLAAAFQMRLGPARPTLRRVLLLYPQLGRLLVDLFHVRLDPDRQTSRERIAELAGAYVERLAVIDNIGDDRIARTLLAMVQATVRTNYFREMPSPDPYIALKFESAGIPHLPDTAPLYEIHVNSPRMEGCHLRGGRIARGGIRFSDRPDDYRTEILDLMKTQTVKNAIIVPVGSKGGFIVKAHASREPNRQPAVEAYETLINAMLDLTDNLVEGRIVHPPRVKVLDDDGPYLVVAADKGTAQFSDIANDIAEQHGFWLGDAFASGGKHGYDHKQIGITARGAWESIKRHLREMGRDPFRGKPITMVGIGDMSGDVFGNGLLQSDNVKLVAAFDHRHIFMDPDPDPVASFAERKRLFEKPGSQWADYNPALISRGGGVFRRGQKRIMLSPEACAVLGCETPELNSDSLIQAILCANVDLIYNGGIGTYVRASDETDAEVGDHANDACRIAANELRTSVAVEGGNLGFTQKARIEYALAGGRINTDAIDNSAGVDMSDHEVNLKILLQPAVVRKALAPDERNRLIAAAAPEAVISVLGDNRDQVLSLSLEQIRSRSQLAAFRDHLTAIEARGLFRGHEEVLPKRETLRERRSRYPGLTRPELAVIGARTKIDLVKRLERSTLVDDPYLVERFLRPYFPVSIAQRFHAEIPHHSLRRELVATRVVNALVDLMGSVFVFNLERDYGIEAKDAVRAWLIAAGVLGIHERAEGLKTDASQLTAEAEPGAFMGLERATKLVCEWALGHRDSASSIGEIVERFAPALTVLGRQFESMLTGGERQRFERIYREFRAAVHQEELAHELARLAFVDHLLNVLTLTLERGIEPARAAEVYFGLSTHIDFAMLQDAVAAIGGEDRWERRAARDLRAELTEARTELCCAIMMEREGTAEQAIERMRLRCERCFGEVERLMGELGALSSIGLPALQVGIRAVARLVREARAEAGAVQPASESSGAVGGKAATAAASLSPASAAKS